VGCGGVEKKKIYHGVRSGCQGKNKESVDTAPGNEKGKKKKAWKEGGKRDIGNENVGGTQSMNHKNERGEGCWWGGGCH